MLPRQRNVRELPSVARLGPSRWVLMMRHVTELEIHQGDQLFYKELVCHVRDVVGFTDRVRTIGQWNQIME